MEESSGTVFSNTFSDSEDEIETDTEYPDNCAGVEVRETKHASHLDKVDIDLPVGTTNEPLKSEGPHLIEKHKQTSNESKDAREGSDRVLEAKHNKQSKQRYTDNLSHGWALYEDDLWCIPLTTYNKNGQSLPSKKPQSAKGSKNYSKKLLMKTMRQSKKGMYRLVYVSPMAMIAKEAKRNGYDLATFMETSEFIGGPSFQLPCMQCYEKNGGNLSGGLSSMFDGMGQGGSSSNGKCLTCGGQVQTLAMFGKMIRQMREKIEAKGLVPHDVYPDGNCLFAAIVDQLRVMGDFSFTLHTLRQSAVEYLKEHPTADDGTPLEMFLTDDETWDMYLARMSEDGEWGDHMILRAVTNVINRMIVIYGGTSGQSETILSPNPKGETDSAEAGVMNSQDEGTIYLGHVSESHYISLRPKCWREDLRKGFQQSRKSAESASKKVMLASCPINQIDFILRQAFRMDCIQSYGSELIDTSNSNIELSGCKMDMFGSVVCRLVPRKMKSTDFGPDISMFFPSAKEEEHINGCFQDLVLSVFSVPNDTKIVTTMTSANAVDLIAENDANVIGNLKLIPKIPELWRGQTILCEENLKKITYLKDFGLDLDIGGKMLASTKLKGDTKHVFSLAFKCDWPSLADEWPRRNRQSGFPDEYTIQTVVDGGCHVIALTSDTKLSDVIDDPINFFTSQNDHTWCYTFAAAEKEICRFLSAEQRNTFLVFKALVDDTLKDIPFPPSVVKSIFFYACENIEKQKWKSKPGECILILLKKFVEGLKNHHIQQYFLQEKNLLACIPREVIDECCERLECARRMPVVTLYFLLDRLNIMSSDVGGFVEGIIENMKVDSKAFTNEVIACRSLLPVCTELMENMIYQDDFQSACLVFQDVVEQEGGDLQTHGIDLMKRLFHNLHIGYIWCFALYIDIKRKTNLTSKACDGYSTVHVTEVFGPDCVDEVPDTLVPECFSIESGDLNFASTVSGILSDTISGRLYIKCMKFYLTTYGVLAGDSLVISKYSHQASMTRKMLVAELQDVYVRLFNFCFNNGIPEEFREMMPVYTKIAEMLGPQVCLRNLVCMWRSLGENKKAEEVSKRVGAGKEGNAFRSLVSSMLNGYELD